MWRLGNPASLLCQSFCRRRYRLFQERSVPNIVLVGVKVLRVLAIAPYMGAEVGYTSVRTCVFSRGCGLLPGHRDRSRVSPYTCGEGVVCVGLEKGLRCCKEVVISPWTRGQNQSGLLELLATLECVGPVRQARHVGEYLCAHCDTLGVHYKRVFLPCFYHLILEAGENILHLHSISQGGVLVYSGPSESY